MQKIQLSDHFTYKKIFRFCLPSIAMMIFTSVYGVVDGFFISNVVGKVPFAAVNIIFPFIMIVNSFGFMIGTGGSALVAKTLGENDPEKANRYFTMMIKLTAAMGITVSTLGIIFLKPLSYLLGATDDMIDYCVTYGRTALTFNTFFMLQNSFQSFLATAEKAKLGLVVTVAAGITNMVLDWLLIAVLKWSVFGAALATGLSGFVGGFLPFIYFIRPNTSLLRLVRTKMQVSVLLKACANGSSELMSNISGSLVSMLYNLQLMKYSGENGVAAYGVLMYIQFIFIAIFIGYTIGTAPVIGYHYGAGHHDELKNLLKKSFVIVGIAGIIMLFAARFLSKTLAGIFVGYD
nr:MATE family efflux transporter [Oscillospiraceae bacterium]